MPSGTLSVVVHPLTVLPVFGKAARPGQQLAFLLGIFTVLCALAISSAAAIFWRSMACCRLIRRRAGVPCAALACAAKSRRSGLGF